eukprot:1146403-Pelagomonas_calceolata.AAC.2
MPVDVWDGCADSWYAAFALLPAACAQGHRKFVWAAEPLPTSKNSSACAQTTHCLHSLQGTQPQSTPEAGQARHRMQGPACKALGRHGPLMQHLFCHTAVCSSAGADLLPTVTAPKVTTPMITASCVRNSSSSTSHLDLVAFLEQFSPGFAMKQSACCAPAHTHLSNDLLAHDLEAVLLEFPLVHSRRQHLGHNVVQGRGHSCAATAGACALWPCLFVFFTRELSTCMHRSEGVVQGRGHSCASAAGACAL